MENLYKLDKADHSEIYSEIAGDYLGQAQTQEKPRAVITGGQPGSGKGTLADQAGDEFKSTGSFVLIDVDELRKMHPLYEQLQHENDREAANLVHPDASAWASQLLQDAAAARKNLVIDQTSKSPDALLDLSKQLKEAGYQVEMRCIAVNPEISEGRIHKRYEEEKRDFGVGRFVPAEIHYAAYLGLPESIAAVEREKAVDTLKIYDQNQENIYEINLKNGEWDRAPEGKATLEKERTRPLTLEQQKQQISAYAQLSAMLENRNAEPAEREVIHAWQVKATRKLAAESFRQLSPVDAVKEHPELSAAYSAVNSTRVSCRENGLSPEQRHVVMHRARHQIAAAVERGIAPKTDYFQAAFDSNRKPAMAVKADVGKMFALVPNPKLEPGNISAKVAVSDLQALKVADIRDDREAAARSIVEKLNEIRASSTDSGKAEIRHAAVAVAALCSADHALASEITAVADAESNPYIVEIIDQGQALSAQQQTQDLQHQGPEIEM